MLFSYIRGVYKNVICCSCVNGMGGCVMNEMLLLSDRWYFEHFQKDSFQSDKKRI